MLFHKKDFRFFDPLKLCFRISTKISLGIVFFTFLSALLPFALVIFNAQFINTAIEYTQNRDVLFKLIVSISILALIFAFTYFQSILSRLINEKLGIRLREKLDTEMIDKCVRIKYEYIENSETCNLINRVMDIQPRIQGAFFNLLSIVSTIVQLISISSLIVNVVWWAFPILLISSLPLIIITYFEGKETYEITRWEGEISRKSDYIEFSVLRSRDCADERTLFGYSEYFNEQFEKYFKTCVRRENQVNNKWLLASKSACTLIIIICCAILYFIIGDLRNNVLSIGFFISITGAMIQLAGVLTGSIPGIVNQLVSDHEYLKDLSEFAKLEDESTTGEGLKFANIETIEFRDVYFKYPGTEKLVLNGVSFKIRQGSHFAIVGKNGSGKSTITKLLLKLYHADSGDILINGQEINEISNQEIYKLFSVVYQDFSKYSISAKDNIGIGNIDHYDDFQKIQQAANLANVDQDIAQLPNKYETCLGKIFTGGVDLSGGQWQKLVLARSLMKEHSIKILDEPTAALDPIQESHLYQQYAEISHGNTTIFISHRLGSTKLADTILLIDEGKILGCDTHDKLMETNLLYNEMFSIQKGWYVNGQEATTT